MKYTLELQLEDLSLTIKKALKNDTIPPSELRFLFEAQKTLLECIIINKHINSKDNNGCGDNCAC